MDMFGHYYDKTSIYVNKYYVNTIIVLVVVSISIDFMFGLYLKAFSQLIYNCEDLPFAKACDDEVSYKRNINCILGTIS
ncbi:hypothetical protein BpHYR1_018329 [Brachionus plicatilis]|uniref:Uncharacterized protein n=1 Tax=Brachionus plicatilis TaxID=10195 RepID=A0A3M7R428_BRAPC|nr:hypothetical protein BpHYR1_018329 [Brachionus plicatilis]